MEKQNILDLAILGGPKAFDEPVVVGRPNSVNQEVFFSKVKDALDRKRLTNDGPFVQELENKIAKSLGVAHCIAVSNGTSGLEIALQAAGLSGEVIVPSFTYVATPHALLANHLIPVFCDIEADTYNLRPSQVEQLISPRTTGILGVHLWGRPCNIQALTNIARSHELKLIFDAAHAFGCAYRGTSIGNFGDMEVFSFHATKFFNTVEGGAIVTNNSDYARQARQIRNFGFSQEGQSVTFGTNAKMNEISAAMGLTMFADLESLIAHNHSNYSLYRQYLADTPGLRMIQYEESEPQNFQFIVLEIEKDLTGISRDELLAVLKSENIIARRYFQPGNHRRKPYVDLPDVRHGDLSVTEQMCRRLLVLPTGNTINASDIKKISQVIRMVVTQTGEIKAKIQKETHRALFQEQ